MLILLQLTIVSVFFKGNWKAWPTNKCNWSSVFFQRTHSILLFTFIEHILLPFHSTYTHPLLTIDDECLILYIFSLHKTPSQNSCAPNVLHQTEPFLSLALIPQFAGPWFRILIFGLFFFTFQTLRQIHTMYLCAFFFCITCCFQSLSITNPNSAHLRSQLTCRLNGAVWWSSGERAGFLH